jgi:hypothetical protein
MISGIHANLRDLSNDMNHSVLTTVMVLGARPAQQGRVILSRRLIAYATIIQLAMDGLIVYALAENLFHYDNSAMIFTSGLVVLLMAYTTYLGLKTLNATSTDYEMMVRTGLLHLLMIIATLIGAFAVTLGIGLFSVLMFAYIVPLLTSNVIPEGASQPS